MLSDGIFSRAANDTEAAGTAVLPETVCICAAGEFGRMKSNCQVLHSLCRIVRYFPGVQEKRAGKSKFKKQGNESLRVFFFEEEWTHEEMA